MKNRKLLFIVFLLCFLGFELKAQIPQITVSGKAETKIVLSALKARVRIFGHLAETTMTMDFYNPNSRVLEGELEFPMPEGAVISGYALDVAGRLIDGVAVEKQKAREVFEAEVRKGVDPGIIEKVKGNNFKTRVYPLPANGSRTVSVTYISELRVDDAEAIFRMPLALTKLTRAFDLRVEVLSVEVQPSVKLQGAPEASFRKANSGWFMETSLSEADLQTDLVVTVPVPQTGAVFVEKSADGNYYFSIQGQVKNPQQQQQSAAANVALLFDASDSGRKRDLKLEKKFLQSLFASAAVAESFRVNLVEFRNQPGAGRSFSLKRGQADELLAYMDSIEFDGGTSFAGLSEAAGKADLVIVLSDGIANFGRSALPEFAAPVFAVCSVDGADYDFLRSLSSRNGGSLVNLKNLEADQAAAAIRTDFFGITEKKLGRGLTEVYPTG